MHYYCNQHTDPTLMHISVKDKHLFQVPEPYTC